MIVAGILALVWPVVSSFAAVFALGWLGNRRLPWLILAWNQSLAARVAKQIKARLGP